MVEGSEFDCATGLEFQSRVRAARSMFKLSRDKKKKKDCGVDENGISGLSYHRDAATRKVEGLVTQRQVVSTSNKSSRNKNILIKQNGRSIAYYSRKLNSAQKNYTTIEKELLSIVETFREYRNILLGAQIRVHTDHKNLTHQMTKFTTQRVLRWRLLLDEFGATFHYKTGSTNFIADALSRVPISFPDGKNLTPSDMLHACFLADGLLGNPGW
ncbi:hypothetical protein IV203_011711 [Nitzschia inconspicua]|uniref:Reverse transcriptase RNase H-like domain-containing protein n=1 Tax=Nitzschia inconspicua TaxID=303405 RepID=A0A9K3KSB8_9STRA|nr:hypothetical protein IV203_011711 [Nitzschia inconspicua]